MVEIPEAASLAAQITAELAGQTITTALFAAIKTTLADMTAQGGRDTERDLFGRPGGYRTLRTRHAVGEPCPRCGGSVRKEAYLGGAVYWCGGCQAA